MKKILSFFAMLMLVSIFAANLMAQTPQYYNFNNGTVVNSYPFNSNGGKAVNSLFPAGAFINPTPIPSGMAITKVYFRMATEGIRYYSTLQILMAQSTITDLTTATFYAGPWDTVYNHSTTKLTSTVGGWISLTLDRNFYYDPAKSLILFVGHCGSSGGSVIGYNSSGTGIKRVWSVAGCPFTPYAGGDGLTLNFGVDVVDAVGVMPDGKANQNNLIQNFPNPFNNNTIIAYNLKENTNVVLKVFDLMGKEVSTLVNKTQTAGKYEVEFDGSNLPSGFYIYQLTTNTETLTKRMIIEE